MSTLSIQLIYAGRICSVLSVKAENLVITDLTISSATTSLPTLVSTENVVGQVNTAGFELATPQVVYQISSLINSYYLPTHRTLWRDMTIDLDVIPISEEHAGYYQEIGYMRGAVIQSIEQARSYEHQGNYMLIKKTQDTLVDSLQARIQSRRTWWKKIPEFLIKTALPFVFNAFMGFTLHALFASVFGAAFRLAPEYF